MRWKPTTGTRFQSVQRGAHSFRIGGEMMLEDDAQRGGFVKKFALKRFSETLFGDLGNRNSVTRLLLCESQSCFLAFAVIKGHGNIK